MDIHDAGYFYLAINTLVKCQSITLPAQSLTLMKPILT